MSMHHSKKIKMRFAFGYADPNAGVDRRARYFDLSKVMKGPNGGPQRPRGLLWKALARHGLAGYLSRRVQAGIFAGIDISGGVLSPDTDANTDAYGADVDPKAIVFGDVPAPLEANPLLEQLSRHTAVTSGVK